jgi:hypothetical protein
MTPDNTIYHRYRNGRVHTGCRTCSEMSPSRKKKSS